ncbi:MAG: hypothetical protein WAP47_15455, partial [Candidatus Rokuibacteriota bacterium]
MPLALSWMLHGALGFAIWSFLAGADGLPTLPVLELIGPGAVESAGREPAPAPPVRERPRPRQIVRAQAAPSQVPVRT